MERQTPVFVRIEDYKDVLDIVELIKAKVVEGKQIIGDINTLKNQEDNELDLWNNELNDIERKIEYMDKSLFEPENL